MKKYTITSLGVGLGQKRYFLEFSNTSVQWLNMCCLNWITTAAAFSQEERGTRVHLLKLSSATFILTQYWAHPWLVSYLIAVDQE